jgi:hypothetical protein
VRVQNLEFDEIIIARQNPNNEIKKISLFDEMRENSNLCHQIFVCFLGGIEDK